MRNQLSKAAFSLFLAILFCVFSVLPACAQQISDSQDTSNSESSSDSLDENTGDATSDNADETYLNISGEHTLNEIEEILDRHPGLKKVDMFDTPVGREDVEELESRYPDIEFGWTLKIGDHKVRTDTTAFSTLHRDGAAGHRDELPLLRYCKKLKALDIGHNRLTDISFVADLKELRILIVSTNNLTDISPVENLKKLEYLEMFNNKIESIAPVKGLTRLMDLNISNNKIKDLSPLYEMPWLKRLWIGKSSNVFIKKEIKDKLKASLPNTQIYNGEPTYGGWRGHPHFKIIYNMFRSPDGYVPFEDSFKDDGIS